MTGAVVYQAKREMPVSLEELVMSWQAVGEPQAGRRDVFVVVFPGT